MIWEKLHSLYDGRIGLEPMSKLGETSIEGSVSRDYHMTNPSRFAQGEETIHPGLIGPTCVTSVRLMKTIIGGLDIQQDQIGIIKHREGLVRTDNTTGIKGSMQPFLFAQPEILLDEIGLHERFSPTHRDTTPADIRAVTKSFLEELLGFPFKLDWSLRIPGIRIMAECTSHGTSLHECHKAYTRTVHGTKRFYRMYSALHMSSLQMVMRWRRAAARLLFPYYYCCNTKPIRGYG